MSRWHPTRTLAPVGKQHRGNLAVCLGLEFGEPGEAGFLRLPDLCSLVGVGNPRLYWH
jgi:hypothetical protein